jgi:hypothetical protein
VDLGADAPGRRQDQRSDAPAVGKADDAGRDQVLEPPLGVSPPNSDNPGIRSDIGAPLPERANALVRSVE